MNEPLISVIVPVYNVELYIDRCIRSIVEQTYRNLEIILVDDGSYDGCPVICDLWAERDDRIKVIHKENGGSSSARNTGLDACVGEYVTFVDSDDWIELDYYEKVIRSMLCHNAQIGCAGRYDVDEETLKKKVGLCPVKQRILKPTEMLKRMLTWRECDFSACDKIFEATLWESMRFPEGKTSEDVGCLYQIVDRAERILIYPVPMYNYFHRKGSMTAVNCATRNTHIVEFADDICAYAHRCCPNILTEAEYFKFKTLLYWNRGFLLQQEISVEEQMLHRKSINWLRKRILFVLFSCPYVGLKDKFWYCTILLKMKHTVQWLVSRKRK